MQFFTIMNETIDIDKIVYVLRGLYSGNPSESSLLNIIDFSTFEFEKTEHRVLAKIFYGLQVNVHVELDIYTKNHQIIEQMEAVILNDLIKITDLVIDKVKILPDYDKFEIINSEIKPVYTEWEEINRDQIQLINQLKTSTNSIDFQNIGNTSRTILQNLSKIVFKKEKHSPKDLTIDVSAGKFKNQLHSYIKVELSGDSNKELRNFAETAITLIERAIDLANNITHKLRAEKNFAEVCVVGTLSAISIIKSIEKN